MRPVFRIALNRRPRYRRVISAALLIAFVATAAGIPMPTGARLAVTEKSNETFLCATSGCGCATADQCWRSCCCHTLAERLAWARANGVRPPDFAIAQARAGGHDLNWVDRRNCADGKLICQAGSCCEKDLAPAAHSCCSTEQNAEPQRNVIAWRALKCGGQSMNWLVAVPTVIKVQADFIFEIAPPTWLKPPASDRACGTADLPAVPPPERA